MGPVYSFEQFSRLTDARRKILEVYGAVVDALGVRVGLNRLVERQSDHDLISYYVAQSMADEPSREHSIAIATCHGFLQLLKEAGDETLGRIVMPTRSDIVRDPQTGEVSVTVKLRPATPGTSKPV
jgi:hypothetical protein